MTFDYRTGLGACVLLPAILGCQSQQPPLAETRTQDALAPVEYSVQTYVPRATCRPEDRPEQGLQGQVSLVERVAGYSGSSCNLDLVSQYEGEGASWMHAAYKDCAYYGQAYAVTAISSPDTPRATLLRPGTVVMDVRDSTAPRDVGRLTTISMLDPWEALKVNTARGLLAAVNGTSAGGGPEFDVYDISKNCAEPELLFSGPLQDSTVIGHEGEWAPDGMTYYGGDLNQGQYYAIDVSNPAEPEFITKFTPPVGVHGLSVSPDGRRGFVTLSGQSRNEGNNTNGFAVYDFTPISTRANDPTPTLLAEVYWDDGAVAQHTIPVKIRGREYLITVDELGSDGTNAIASRQVTCGTDRLAYGIPRIFDISDLSDIQLVAKLTLEINQPENCEEAAMDTTGLILFGYDSHYCQVDNPEDAKMLACSYFNSGLRLFDISNPHEIIEIGYYNPAMKPGQKGGSTYNITGNCFGADWTSSQPYFRRDRNEIWLTSQCAGFQVLAIDPSIIPR